MCSGLTAYAALQKAGRIERDEHILLIGCGGVGMMGIQFARALFEGAPLVADIDAGPAARRRSRAGAGAAPYDAADAGTAERIRADTGTGPGAVVDFVGSEKSFALANRVVRRGGRIVVVGLFGRTRCSCRCR